MALFRRYRRSAILLIAGLFGLVQAGSLSCATAQTIAILPPSESDIVFGKADAPVTIIEYLTYQCPECRAFSWDVFPRVHRELIATGKVRFVRRHAPISDVAIAGAMLVACQSAESRAAMDRELELLQHVWANDPVNMERRLALIALGYGMDAQTALACFRDERGVKAVVAGIAEAQALQIKDFPAFYILGAKGGARLVGETSFEKLTEHINKLSR